METINETPNPPEEVTITEDIYGIKILMSGKKWKKTVKLAEKVINMNSKKENGLKPHEILQVNLCKILGCIKLKLYKLAFEQIKSLGTFESNKFYLFQTYPQFYPKELRGNMIPFSLKVLRAELPALTGNYSVSLDMFYSLQFTCQQNIQLLIDDIEENNNNVNEEDENENNSNNNRSSSSNNNNNNNNNNKSEIFTLEEIDKFSKEIQKELLPELIDFQYQEECYNELLRDIKSFGEKEIVPVNPTIKIWKEREHRVMFKIASIYLHQKEYILALHTLEQILNNYPKNIFLLSSIGRIHLQFGNLETAKNYFNNAKKEFENFLKRSKQNDDDDQKGSSSSYINQLIIQYNVTCLMNESMFYISTDKLQMAIQSLDNILDLNPNYLPAVNNKAVCLLYISELSQAIETIENLILNDPKQHLNEPIVFNLCTLYDLHPENPILKKKKIKKLIIDNEIEHFDHSVLKLPS